MDKIFFYLFFLSLLFPINSVLHDQRREELLDKLMIKIAPEDSEEITYKIFHSSKSFKEKITYPIKYNVTKIDEIIEKYRFPKNYDFLNETNITAKVKDQGKCGSGWSFSATSALSYRYEHLYNISVDLSPQDAISCLVQSCKNEYDIVDIQMNLVKKGALTEQCFPYTAKDGETIDECLDEKKKCSNEEIEFKKYKAKNIYTTVDYYDDETFYHIVEIIMDQLTTNGPVVSYFGVFSDFYEGHNDTDYIYTYNESAQYQYDHAAIIVGYGYSEEQKKYYWILQDSRGTECHNNGFVKIEFGQVGTERIAFSEPYVPQENPNVTDVYASLWKFDEKCYLYINITDNTYRNMTNTLELTFKNNETNDFQYFQCSIMPGEKKDEENKVLKGFMDWNIFLRNPIGKYILSNYTSLEKENHFILNDSLLNHFDYLGVPVLLFPFLNSETYYFISGAGSRIIFLFNPYDLEEVKMTDIYPYINADIKLGDCHMVDLEDYDYNLVYCDIQEDELNYFPDVIGENKSSIHTKGYCGYWHSLNTFVYRFNMEEYPKITIENIYQPKTHNISDISEFKIKAKYEGYIDPNLTDLSLHFTLVANAEYEEKNHTYFMICDFEDIDNKTGEMDILCNMKLKEGFYLSYKNLYILPYSVPDYNLKNLNSNNNKIFLFEIVLKDTIVAEDDEEPEPTPEEEEGEDEEEKHKEEEEHKEEEHKEEEKHEEEKEHKEEEKHEEEKHEEEKEHKEEEREKEHEEEEKHEEEEEKSGPEPKPTDSEDDGMDSTTLALIIVFSILGGLILIGGVFFLVIHIRRKKNKIKIDSKAIDLIQFS